MEEIIRIFPQRLQEFCRQAFERPDRPEELRIRIGQPLQLLNGAEELFWSGKGGHAGNSIRHEPLFPVRL